MNRKFLYSLQKPLQVSVPNKKVPYLLFSGSIDEQFVGILLFVSALMKTVSIREMKAKNMLQRENTAQLKRIVERKSQRLQLTESLQDYFALNPTTYKRHIGQELPNDWFVPDETETSQSHTSSTTISSSLSTSLDGTHHMRRQRSSEACNDSLDFTFHRERKLKEETTSRPVPMTETRQEKPKSGRRVKWLMDFDPSDGSIE